MYYYTLALLLDCADLMYTYNVVVGAGDGADPVLAAGISKTNIKIVAGCLIGLLLIICTSLLCLRWNSRRRRRSSALNPPIELYHSNSALFPSDNCDPVPDADGASLL